MKAPIMSIVMANKNHGLLVEKTLNSYINQSFNDFEIICIDGDSKDNSIRVISKFTGVKLFSEPDKSGAEAFAKGIQRARSKYIMLGNSTDFLIDENFISSAITYLEMNESISLVFGKVATFNIESKSFQAVDSYTKSNFGDYQRNFATWLVSGETFHEHACVIRRDIFNIIFEDLSDYFESIDKLDNDLFLTLRYRFHAYGFRAEYLPLDVLGVVNHENRVSVDQRKHFLRHLEFYNFQMKQFRKNFIKGEKYKFVSVGGTDTEVISSALLLKLELLLFFLKIRGILSNFYRKILK
jgi:glycosyltransferase involved in cell wall biosynthesis